MHLGNQRRFEAVARIGCGRIRRSICFRYCKFSIETIIMSAYEYFPTVLSSNETQINASLRPVTKQNQFAFILGNVSHQNSLSNELFPLEVHTICLTPRIPRPLKNTERYGKSETGYLPRRSSFMTEKTVEILVPQIIEIS